MSWFQEHKKATFSLSGLVAVLVVAAIVYFVHFHTRGSEAAAQGDGSGRVAKKQTAPLRVKVVRPKEEGVERLVHRPATVQAFDFADLYAKVSGYLANQEVDIGSRVQKGEILAEVQAPEFATNEEKARADVHKAQANAKAAAARVDKANADVEVAQSEYEQSKSDVTKAEAMKSLREKEYTRIKNLAASNSVTKELVDEKLEARKAAEAALFSAQKAVNTAKSNITAAKARVEQAQADQADAEAQIGVAQADLKRAKVFVQYTRIASPYDGVITKRNYHNGAFIRDAAQGGDTPLLAVARIDKMRVIVQVPDRAVPYLKVGDPVTLTVDTLEARHFEGKVARMAYLEAYDTRTMRTEVDISNPDNLLKDGMYGEITIHLGREKGLRIPSKCLVGNEKGDERSVYVVRDGKAHQVKVEIGIDDGIEVTIRKGLSTSDQVVSERPSGLGDKMSVEVIRDRSEDADKEDKVKTSDNKERTPASDNDTSGQKKSKGK